MNIFILASTVAKYRKVAEELFAGGFRGIAGIPDGIRTSDPNRLSSEQLTELADDLVLAIDEADVVVVACERGYDAATFFAGVAYAIGVPVVTVDAFDQIGLYAERVNNIDLGSLVQTVKKLSRRAEKTQPPAAEHGTVLLSPPNPHLTPERETSDGPVTSDDSGAQGQP